MELGRLVSVPPCAARRGYRLGTAFRAVDGFTAPLLIHALAALAVGHFLIGDKIGIGHDTAARSGWALGDFAGGGVGFLGHAAGRL